MRKSFVLLACFLGGAQACATVRPTVSVETAEAELRAAEIAFAKTMADRDHAAFVSHLAEDAVFVGPEILRGRQAVADGWKKYFEGDAAPFSWTPERVAVTGGGTLGVSSGPVHDASKKRVGTFNSTWRRDASGTWKVVLDIGCPPCE
jgi:ketosteroid isomerase-like protein